MILRKLKLDDGELMLEWMHDPDVVRDLDADFRNKTLEDCERFIQNSWKTERSDVHLAIADDNNIYQGTVSLKKIDYNASNAEFAIVIRKNSMGKGIAIDAMLSILEMGATCFGLKKIYWCVNKNNLRAIQFYNKNHFVRVNNIPKSICDRYMNNPNLIWYCWTI